MTSGFSNRWGVPALGALMSVILLGTIQQGKAAETGEEIFGSLCAA